MKRWIFCLLASLFLTASATADVLGANDQPIHDAARIGSGKEIDVLLKVNPNTRDVRTAHGSYSVEGYTTSAGADPNARDADGATPLHMAAYSQNAKHSQLLLEAGSDPYAKTNVGRDPTSMARKVMGNEAAGVISLWILKGCQPKKAC